MGGPPPEKTVPRSEGTPHRLRVLGIAPEPPYAVFLQNTPILLDVVPRVGTLGWYALPRWGKWYDHIFALVCSPRFRYRNTHHLSDSMPKGYFIPAQGVTLGIYPTAFFAF